MKKATVISILILISLWSIRPSGAGIVGDINNDGRIDLTEAIYALQVAAGAYPQLGASCLLVGKGSWANGVNYNPCDVVEHGGSNYASIQSHKSVTVSNEPPDETYWTLLALKGETGDIGPQGPQGEAGDSVVIGQTCLPGMFVSGFDSLGQLICGASISDDGDGDGFSIVQGDCRDNDINIHPAAFEECDGIDNNCNAAIDEDYPNLDGDGFRDCPFASTEIRDCDDTDINTYPGAPEIADGKDNDCDGYVDEGTEGCDPNDPDGDGVSECGGDCFPSDSRIYPGASEICDGLDNDCNIFTTENCDLGEACDWLPSTADLCKQGLLCVNNDGCVGPCNSSETGPAGELCSSTQTCASKVLNSANLVFCQEAAFSPGAKHGGELCSSDAECRSLDCARVSPGPNGTICLDHCGSDSYCSASGTVCSLQRLPSSISRYCWNTSLLGPGSVGSACASDSDCDHGLCTQVSGGAICTEACVRDSDCDPGFTCSLQGEQVPTGLIHTPPSASSCTVDSDCTTGLCVSGQCAFMLIETASMCLPDVGGQGSFPAGQACSQNADCRSNFCDSTRNICIEVCGSDRDCTPGLSCSQQVVETKADSLGVLQATSARICLGPGTQSGEVLQRK